MILDVNPYQPTYVFPETLGSASEVNDLSSNPYDTTYQFPDQADSPHTVTEEAPLVVVRQKPKMYEANVDSPIHVNVCWPSFSFFFDKNSHGLNMRFGIYLNRKKHSYVRNLG